VGLRELCIKNLCKTKEIPIKEPDPEPSEEHTYWPTEEVYEEIMDAQRRSADSNLHISVRVMECPKLLDTIRNHCLGSSMLQYLEDMFVVLDELIISSSRRERSPYNNCLSVILRKDTAKISMTMSMGRIEQMRFKNCHL
jgi:hypothetical protein